MTTEYTLKAVDAAGAEELLGAAAQNGQGGQDGSEPYDAESSDRIRELCGGLPLALRIAGSSLGPRSPRRLATDLGAYGPVELVEPAEDARRVHRDRGGQRAVFARRGAEHLLLDHFGEALDRVDRGAVGRSLRLTQREHRSIRMRSTPGGIHYD